MSIINLEGEHLINWRTRQIRAYLNSGLANDEAKALLDFVETPRGFLTTDERERFNQLATKAYKGGYIMHSEKSVQAPGL